MVRFGKYDRSHSQTGMRRSMRRSIRFSACLSGCAGLFALLVNLSAADAAPLQLNQQQYNQQQQGGYAQGNGQQGASQQNGQAIPRGPIDPRISQQAPRSSQDSILPRPFAELSADHLAYIDQLLAYWEGSSAKIDMFECEFESWEYDPVFGPKRDAEGVLPAKTISRGTIKFKAPDKGLYFVHHIWEYRQTDDPRAEPYQPAMIDRGDKAAEPMQEKWICDGEFVFEYNFQDKKLIKRELPPELKGEGLAHGPLPFLFGAKKDDIKTRYWLRVITPEGSQGEYWLEAYPKYPADARNYQKVVIILDEADFLPKATELFDPNFHAETNPARTVFQFNKREIFNEGNSLNPENLIKRFSREFFNPKAERGWQLIEQPYAETAANPQGHEQGRR